MIGINDQTVVNVCFYVYIYEYFLCFFDSVTCWHRWQVFLSCCTSIRLKCISLQFSLCLICALMYLSCCIYYFLTIFLIIIYWALLLSKRFESTFWIPLHSDMFKLFHLFFIMACSCYCFYLAVNTLLWNYNTNTMDKPWSTGNPLINAISFKLIHT